MAKIQIELRNEKRRAFAAENVLAAETDELKPSTVVIYPWEETRRLRQNNLYWQHVTEITEHYLLTKKDERFEDLKMETHYDLKRRFLHPIFMTSGTKGAAEYRKTYAALCTVASAKALPAQDIRQMHREFLSTARATVGEMAKYIDAYWLPMNQEGIHLTDPEEQGNV